MERDLCYQDDEASLSSTEVEEQLPEQMNPMAVSHVKPLDVEGETR